MVGSVARSRVAGLVAGIAVVATAAFAHVRAGGSLDATTSVPLMLGLVGAAAGLAPSLRWTFGRLIVASLAAQAMLHVASGLASPQAQLASGSHHHTHSTAMHAVDGSGLDMWALHVGLAIMLAVVARWGARWLRSMPGIVRALFVAVRDVRPVLLVRQRLAPSVDRWCGRHVGVAWDSRGPPAVV